METRLYFQLLRRGWWIIALTTLFALVAALAASYFATPLYTASARVLVSPSASLVNNADVLHTIDTLNNQSVMSTYAEVMNSAQIYNNTLAFMQLQPAALEKYTHVAKVVANSSVLQVDVTGPDPLLATKVANALCFQTTKFSTDLNQVYTVTLLDAAVPPIEPSSPRPLLNAGLAIAAGLIVGILLAVGSEQLRTPVEVFRQRLRLDSMSDVYNNRHFTRLVDEELAQSSKEPVSVGIVELSGLRDLAGTLPLSGLQKVNRDVTEVLRRELRGNDIVGRWNDISFGVMLPRTPATAASRIFERIQAALSQPMDVDQLNLGIKLDSRVGGAESGTATTTQALFEKANSALDKTRRDHSSRVCVEKA